MKKKILLIALLSSVSLSVYPASVSVRNLTNMTVWARAFQSGVPYFIGPISPQGKKSTPNLVGVPNFDYVQFFYVRGYKNIRGGYLDLMKQVQESKQFWHTVELKKSGDELSYCHIFKPHWIKYLEDRSVCVTFSNPNKKDYTIRIPTVEQFTYKLDKPARRVKLDLRNWGNVVRTDWKGKRQEKKKKKK